MKKAKRITIVSLLVFMLHCSTSTPHDDDLYSFALAHQNDLSLSTYVTAHSVQRLLADTAGRREALSLLKAHGITNVYLEVYRSGVVVPSELLRTVRDFFQDHGIQVVGGIVTVPGGDFGVRQQGRLGWFNWQAEKTQQDLERVMREAASIFDTFIVDDFLCTADTSQESKTAKGQRSWSQYRRDLLTQISQDVFITPAREVNPDITMIIKYPQWYDRFHLFGYDVARQPDLFDVVWVGTETRGQYTQRFGFVQPYEGFVNYRWLASRSGEKIGGAWFDHGDCDAQDFIEQAFQTVLAGAREIVIFNYDSFVYGHRGHHLLRREFEHLVELAQAVGHTPVQGIPAYKPPNSDAGGDLYIMDYIGMLGVPLVPVATYPEQASTVFLPTQAAADSGIAAKIQTSLSRNCRIIVTTGFLANMQHNRNLVEMAGLEWPVTIDPAEAQKIIVNQQIVPLPRPLNVESPLRLTTATPLLTTQFGPFRLPYLTKNQAGNIFVLNCHTFSQADFDAVDEVLLCPRPLGLLDVPQSWANTLRDAFGGQLGIQLSAPTRVTLQPLGKTNVVLHNYNTQHVDVVLNLQQSSPLMDVFSGTRIDRQNGAIKLTLPPRSRMWLHPERSL